MKFQRKRNLYVFETREFTMRVCISFRFKLCRSKLPKLYINSLHEFRSRNVNHLYRQNYGNFFYFFFFSFYSLHTKYTNDTSSQIFKLFLRYSSPLPFTPPIFFLSLSLKRKYSSFSLVYS